MPAPLVIAHMEIARLLEDAGAPLMDPQRAGIYLTNALTGWVPAVDPKPSIFLELQQEKEDSERIKRKENIVVVLGNPPYNGYAGMAIGEERDLVMPYRKYVEGLALPQGQGLNDLYIRFFRVAERKIVGDKDVAGSSGGGIVSFISNNAWLDGLSHTTMRHHYLQTFQQIYIDNLNGDKYRTGKTTPEGKPDPSAFSTAQNREGIQVGTAIATLVRNADRAGAEGGRGALIRDIWGAGKLSHLERESRREHEPVYTELTPVAALGNPLAHRAHSVAYTSWPRLCELFPVFYPGVKTSRDPLVVDIDEPILVARMKRYFDSSLSNEVITKASPVAMKRTARFDPVETRQQLLAVGYKPWQVLRYLYRPFDLRWVYWEPTTRLLGEKSEDYLEQMYTGTQWLEVRQRESGDLFSRGVVTTTVPDNFGNGFSTFIPRQVLSATSLYGGQSLLHPNISELASAYIEEYQADTSNLFFHAVAIMHTPQYRTENAGALLGDWPRIPLPGTAELLAHSAGLGRRLAELLDAESKLKLGKEWSFLAKLQKPYLTELEGAGRAEAERKALALTAGWGSRGQGSTVMPGRGKVEARAWTAGELLRLEALAAGEGMGLDDALGLLGEGCVDVYLNLAPGGGSCWVGVPAKVWSYTLGGYQVLKKWLSYREEGLLGRALRSDEAEYFASVARRIAGILLMGRALDASYRAILPGATGLAGK